MDETEGFGCLGHSNWANCSLLSHFCSQTFPTFSLSCLEANSYYPWMLIMGKGNSHNSRNGWCRGFSVPGAFKLDHLQPFAHFRFPKSHNLWVTPVFQCLGHSNWAICSRLSQFCFPNFQNDSLLYWEANSYYPREGQAGNGKMEISQPEGDTSFSVAGAFKLSHLQQIKPILFP